MKGLSKKSFRKVRFFSKDWFIALWQGERPLWEAWFVFGAVSVSLGYFIFPRLSELYPGLIAPLYFIALFIQIFWWITIWRCAQNANTIFLYLSRGIVLLGVITILAQFLL